MTEPTLNISCEVCSATVQVLARTWLNNTDLAILCPDCASTDEDCIECDYACTKEDPNV